MPRPRPADPIPAPAGHVALLLHERVRGRGKPVSGIGEHDETEIDVARRGVIRALPRTTKTGIIQTNQRDEAYADNRRGHVDEHDHPQWHQVDEGCGDCRRGDADRRLQRAVNRVDAQQPRLRAICGMNDCTAGVWIPPPAERMTRTTRISPVSPQPTAILADRHMVTAAMTASGSMTNSLRFHLSAQTPPNTETIACGRAAATIAPVMTMPEFDRKTRYQKIAYCTTLEPNSDSVCSTVCRPIQCITGRAVHVVLVPTPRSWITACLPLRAAAHHVRRQGRADRRARQRPSDVQGRALLGGQGPMRHAVRHDRP